MGHIGGAGLAGALPLHRRGDLPQTQAFGLMAPAPQKEKNHTGHRQGQQQAHPHQLIGGAAGAQIHPDRHHGASQLQNEIDVADLFRQQLGQRQRQHDLGNHRQCADGQAGGGGDPPFRPLFRLGQTSFSHGAVHLLLSQLRPLILLLYRNTQHSATNIL